MRSPESGHRSRRHRRRDRAGHGRFPTPAHLCSRARFAPGVKESAGKNRRIARRRGKKWAIVAVGRSILIIVWHLLADPDTRFHDLGSRLYDTRVSPERKKRNHVHQIEALGYKVALEPAA